MDNDDLFNTGWDPYDTLLQCQHNIQQCVFAIQHSSEILKDLASKHKHQQEVIQQLMFQNKKLHAMVEHLNVQVLNQGLEIQTFKTKLPQ